MANMNWAGVNVADFGAMGDGAADDSTAIANAVASGEDIWFPEGVYAIKQSLVLPAGKRLILVSGARFTVAAGAVLTVNSSVQAGLYPIFTGSGSIISEIPNRTVYPQWFGASGMTGTGGRGIVATGSMTAGSNELVLDSGFDRFRDGQTLLIMHAGKAAAVATPAAPSLQLTSFAGTVTTGSTAYSYRIAEITPEGAVSPPSPAARITNGPDLPSAFEYWRGTRIKLTMPSSSSAGQGWAVYGEDTNPEGHRGLLAIQWKRQPEWNDIHNGSIERSAPPWVPASLPTQTLSSYLIATIVSGGGTGRLILSAAAGTSVSSAAIMADDAPALQRAYDFLESGGGGALELREGRFYMHSPTSGDKKSAVYFTSGVITRSLDRSILQTYPNLLVDGQVTMSGKNGNVLNWGFEGVIFDGGNEVNTTEYYNWIIGTLPNASGTGSYSNYHFDGCEFRYIVGKALVTSFGNSSNYRIENNYIHHCNSNAMSAGGRNYSIAGNTCEYCLAGTPAYIGGAESIILTESYQARITGNTIRSWGNISAGNAFRYEDIEVSGNRMEDQSGIGFGGYCQGVNIIGNILTLTNNGYISGAGINWELSQGTGRYAYDVRVSGNIIHCTGNVSPITFNVIQANTLSRLTISDNTILHQSSSFETIRVQYATQVVFSGNIVTAADTASDMGLITTGGKNWVIANNRISRRNIQVPEASVCTGNYVGGIRMAGNSVATGNNLDGAQGSNTWGGLINIAGSQSVVSYNEIDMTDVTITLAIAENSIYTHNTIIGNRIKNYGSREPRSLINHNFGSVLLHNSPYNTRWIEYDRIPEQGAWSLGDKAFNTKPSSSSSYEGWICTIPGTAAKYTWTSGTAFELNSTVSANGKTYLNTGISGDGKTGTTPPSHISGAAADGGITWEFVDVTAVFKPFGAIVMGTVDQTAPAVPQGLAAASGNGQADLTWKANTETDLAGYNVYQNSKKITSTPVRATAYTATGLSNGTSYSFQLTAVDASGNESARSAQVNVTPGDTTPPAAPTGLTVTSGVNQLFLSWTANTEEDLAGYNVYRDGAKINSSIVTALSYTDSGLTNGQIYSYTLAAVDKAGNVSAQSSPPVSKAPGDTIAPAPPAGLVGTPGNGQAALTWTASQETDLAGYRVYRDGVRLNKAVLTDASYTDTGLTNEVTYTYHVTAVDTSDNESAPSASVQVMPSEYRTVIVSDSFNRADVIGTLGNADTGQPWIALLGQMKIRSNMAETNAVNSNVSVIDCGRSNCAVIGKLISRGNPVWLVFRAKDSQNLMAVTLRKDGYSNLLKMENGSIALLGIALPGITYADGKEVKIVLKDSRIDLYYDGVFAKTFNETFNQNVTMHGIGGSYTENAIDQFVIQG